MLLSVVVPTYRRPAVLAAVLVALRGQIAALNDEAELIVVDNCPDGSAAEIVARLAPGAAYVPEPRSGIAHARNAGIHRARGSHIVFIDDDQLPAPDWLEHFRSMARRGHAACFGPVRPDFEAPPPVTLRPMLEQLFSRETNLVTGTDITRLRAYLGTGNSMFERSTCFVQAEPFDPRFNRGGEDVWLLRELAQERGVRFVWCAEAAVREAVPATRMTAAYLRQRKFRNGQLRCIVEAGGRRWGTIVFWMAVGLAQAAGYGMASAALQPLDRSRSAALRAKMAGGLGKLLWWWPPQA